MAVNGEKFWARNKRRYKRYVVIPDVVISEVYCSDEPSRNGGGRKGAAAAVTLP